MPTPVEFVADKEPWCQYTLDDGTILRVRIMVTKITRDGLTQDDKPNYMVSFQQVCDITPSELAITSAKEEERAK